MSNPPLQNREVGASLQVPSGALMTASGSDAISPLVGSAWEKQAIPIPSSNQTNDHTEAHHLKADLFDLGVRCVPRPDQTG
jgi:hypothetical protein